MQDISAKSVSDRAMQAVMSKDRQAWLDCFSEDALLRDPVGGSPLDPRGVGLRGHIELGMFWDRVVTPVKEVRFDIREEHCSGASIAKVATVNLTTETGAAISYPGVFVYDVDESGRISQLKGYFIWPA